MTTSDAQIKASISVHVCNGTSGSDNALKESIHDNEKQTARFIIYQALFAGDKPNALLTCFRRTEDTSALFGTLTS